MSLNSTVASTTGPSRLAGKGIYFVLLTLNAVLVYAAITRQWDYGLTNLAAVFLVMIYLVLMERWRPYRTDWQPTAREWKRDGLYLFLAFLVAGVSQALLFGTAADMARATLSLPLALEAPLALLVASLVGYAFHRYSHSNRWLWMVHGIHHLPHKVNVANNITVHFIEVLLTGLLVNLALYALGVSAESVLITGVFTALHGYFTHANVDTQMGWLNCIIACPEGHRLHHSKHVPEAGHFGSELAIWDVVFGTMTWRPGRAPEAYGTDEEDDFPSTFHHLECSLYPLKGLVQLLGEAVRWFVAKVRSRLRR